MSDAQFVSRAGLKLEHALKTFEFDVSGLRCVDLGCNIGGFTDCLLQRGAKKVYAVDTGYGTFAWKLRSDKRVDTFERTNALHFEPPVTLDLAVIDLGWTPQHLALPAGLKWIKEGHLISLVKPHYELIKEEKTEESVGKGISKHAIEQVLKRVRATCASLQLDILQEIISPIKGKKSSKKGAGNSEYLLLLKTPSCNA